MKILALTWKHPLDPTAGGAERYLMEVTRRWADDGHGVTIFGPRNPGARGLTSAGEHPGLEYLARGSRWTVFRAAHQYLRHHGHEYDRVLETVSTRPFAAHSIVGHKAVALYHQTAEEVWNLEFPRPLAIWGRHLLEPSWIRRMRTAQVVANSPSTAAALARFGVVCGAVVPPGCWVPAAVTPRPGPSRHPRLLWVGRMVRTKRPEDALSAYGLVRERLPGTSLDMVGSGYLLAQLAALDSCGVTIHGCVSEQAKRALMARADVLLLPGTREGWGIVAMEAAAHGVPVVAYDIPGLRDAVVDGVTGILVPPNPTALGLAAASLLKDSALWRRLSTAASQRAQEFRWDRASQDLLRALSHPTTPAAGLTASGCDPRAPRQATTAPLSSLPSPSEPHAQEVP